MADAEPTKEMKEVESKAKTKEETESRIEEVISTQDEEKKQDEINAESVVETEADEHLFIVHQEQKEDVKEEEMTQLGGEEKTSGVYEKEQEQDEDQDFVVNEETHKEEEKKADEEPKVGQIKKEELKIPIEETQNFAEQREEQAFIVHEEHEELETVQDEKIANNEKVGGVQELLVSEEDAETKGDDPSEIFEPKEVNEVTGELKNEMKEEEQAIRTQNQAEYVEKEAQVGNKEIVKESINDVHDVDTAESNSKIEEEETNQIEDNLKAETPESGMLEENTAGEKEEKSTSIENKVTSVLCKEFDEKSFQEHYGKLSNEVISAIYHAKISELCLTPTSERLSRFAAQVQQYCSDNVCNLREVGFGPKAAKVLAQSLQHCTRYHTVVLAGNSIGDDGGEAVATIISNNSECVAIDVRGCEIGSRGLTSIFEAAAKSETLTSLDLSGTSGSNRNRMGTRSSRACAECIAQSSVLSVLRLRESSLDSTTMHEFSEADAFLGCVLAELDLSQNMLGNNGIYALTSATLPCLEKLSLSQCKISCAGGAAISDMINKNHLPSITHLDLSENSIGVVGATAFATLLETTASPLQVLNLCGNPLLPEGSAILFAALANSVACKLVQMHFSRCQVGKDGATQCAAFVAVAPKLTKLFLDENDIGDEGCIEIAKALQKTKTLSNLSLAKNHIGNSGGLALAEAFASETMCPLTSLDLGDNRLRNKAGESIAHALEGNTIIKKLVLTQSDINYRAFDKIESILAENRREYVASFSKRMKKERVSLQKSERELKELEQKLKEETIACNDLQKQNTLLLSELEQTKVIKETTAKEIQEAMIEASKNLDDAVSKANIITKDLAATKTEKEIVYKNLVSKQQKERDNSIKLQKQLETVKRDHQLLKHNVYDEKSSLDEKMKEKTEANEKAKQALETQLEELVNAHANAISGGEPAQAQKLNALFKTIVTKLTQQNLLPENYQNALQANAHSRNGVSKGSLNSSVSLLRINVFSSFFFLFLIFFTFFCRVYKLHLLCNESVG
jgi:Ran GTPase-activating protein (RanGAP) involved in mRNA processing and transport